MDSRLRLTHLIAMSCVLVLCARAEAGTVTDRMLFTATGQSQWTNGAALDFNTHGPQFLGIPGFSAGNSVGEIREDCIGPVCSRIGAKLGLTIDGRAGLTYDIVINNGSLSVTLPQRVSFAVPDPAAIKQGGAFDIVSTLLPAATFTLQFPDSINVNGGSHPMVIKTGLQTTGPTVQALVGMELRAHLEAVAQACFVVYCIGPNLNVGIDKTQELLALNPNGNRQLRVLGQLVGSADVTTSVNKGSIAVTAQLPTLNTDSRTRADGFDGNRLTSANRANVLTLTANLDKIVSDLLGLPALNGESDGFGYNIVTANTGLNIDVTQKFTFDPKLRATLNFTSPVIAKTNGVFNPADATSSISFRVGDTLTLRAPNALSLGIAPVYTLDNQTRNETGLRVDGNVFVSAGGASIFGLGLGPLVKESAAGGLADIPLFGENFRVNVADVRTDPFNIVFAYARDSVFAESCIGLQGDSCDRGGYFGYAAPCALVLSCPPSSSRIDKIYRVSDLYDQIIDRGDSCIRFDGLGRPCESDVARQVIAALIARDDTLLLGDTSRFALDENGDNVFLNESLAALLLTDGLLAVTGDTDEGGTQRLTALGFSNDFAAFDVPDGAPLPSDVPEPAGILVLLAGIAGLTLRRRAAARAVRHDACASPS